jgi:hypothetical protein
MGHGRGRLIREPKAHTHEFLRKYRIDSGRSFSNRATAEMECEHFTEVISQFDTNFTELVSPTRRKPAPAKAGREAFESSAA